MHRRDVLGLVAAALTLPLAARLRAASAPQVIVNKVSMAGNRVVIPVTFANGRRVDFFLDTGTIVSLIDAALAADLGLRQRGSTRLGGIGGADTYPLFLADNVVFGENLRQPTAAFAARRGGFGRYAGALAAGTLTALDSDLDLERGEWRLYPQGRRPGPGFVRMSGGFGGGQGGESPRLFAEAEVNGRALRFLLDTGAPGGLSLHDGAARKLGLWDDRRPYAPQRTSGIGGAGGLGRLVRAEQISLAGRSFERPVILLRKDGDSRDEDGIIGLDLLRHFNLATEVRTRSVWLQPHAPARPFADRYNRSGLWIEPQEGTARVLAVGTGSPAQKAGLAVGDRLIGDPAAQFAAIEGPAGTLVSLLVERGGARRPVSFSLADFL